MWTKKVADNAAQFVSKLKLSKCFTALYDGAFIVYHISPLFYVTTATGKNKRTAENLAILETQLLWEL